MILIVHTSRDINAKFIFSHDPVEYEEDSLFYPAGWLPFAQDPKNPSAKNSSVRMPHFEALAQGGMRFSQFYAASPRCTPSRAALLTGKSPAQLHMTFVNEGRREGDGRAMGAVKSLHDFFIRVSYARAIMKRTTLLLATALMLTTTAVALRAQSTQQYKNEVSIEVRDGFRTITANGIPDHVTGQFPNRGNPNSISPQRYTLKVPLKPEPSDKSISTNGQDFGVAVNGVPFDPSTAEFWNGNREWRYEAMTGVLGARGGLGVDENLAHVQPTGAYHYHGLPMGLLKKLDWQHRMALVGWAADGYPIYGNYGYSTATQASSPLKKLKSSYKLRSGERGDGPGGMIDGSFESDFEFVKGGGDLDPWNGRYGVTPEFPKGTYYYVMTDSFPFIPRKFRGTPDTSFQRGGPGGGGPGGGQPGGGPASLAAKGQYLFIQRGNTLYQYSADGLKLLGKTELPPP